MEDMIIPSGYGDQQAEKFTIDKVEVELPSRGLFYENKIESVLVEYMTASDEDVLTTDTLIRAEKQLDTLLKRKIKTPGVNVDTMLRGDKDAILLFLRKSGYGADYEVTATDPSDGSKFKTIVDLDKLSIKPLSVIPSEEGYFNFTLPMSKKVVTFRLLNEQEEIKLTKMIESKAIVMGGIKKGVTERLKARIVAIDGDDSRVLIGRFVEAMSPRDALALRMYMREVEPGLDLNYEFTNPNTGNTFLDDIQFDVRFFYPNA
jgi:hypothetical protein